jgi:hypothetical protein
LLAWSTHARWWHQHPFQNNARKWQREITEIKTVKESKTTKQNSGNRWLTDLLICGSLIKVMEIFPIILTQKPKTIS